MLIDTHCHLSREDYDNIDKVIEENKDAGVLKIAVSCCSKESFQEGLNLKDKYDMVYLTLGYHPEYVDFINESDLDYLKNIIKSSKVVGIGEIGLDYHYTKENKGKQLWLFEEQLKIASEFNLPVVIHSRDATMDTINTLKKYKVHGVIHCFSGSLETAQEYIRMGYSLGIGGVVTFKNSNLKEVVKKLPLESIVLETDSPYLTPEPFRGQKNSSKYIPIIASFIASIYGVSVDEVSRVTTSNAKKIFSLD